MSIRVRLTLLPGLALAAFLHLLVPPDFVGQHRGSDGDPAAIQVRSG